MITKVSFSIDDNQWPKLHIAIERVTSTGARFISESKQQYDLAYGAFENELHNALRPAVAEIVERRTKR